MRRVVLAVLAASCAARQPPAPPELPPVARPAAPSDPAPPWGAQALTLGAVEQIYLTEWSHARNKDRCPMLVITDVGGVTSVSVRHADFGAGWGVAYDAPGAPGTDEAGKPCETCGRSAFGVAGMASERSSAPQSEDRLKWADGSHGVRRKAESGWYVAYLEVAGIDCLYYVWSALNPQHLDTLIRGLRRVERI